MRTLFRISMFAVALLMAATASAKGKKEQKAAEDEKKTEEAAVAAPETAPIIQENTLDDCTDGADNDGDGYVDCDDQDCEIYAVCVKAAPEPEAAEEEEEEEPPPAPVWMPESGLQCRDGRDNNGDGLIDCHEVTCQRYRYCKQIMYETPEPTNKAPGLLVNFGVGVAFPNFRTPTAQADYDSGYNHWRVPFDPDIGGLMAFKLGYLPLKWLGFGMNLMGGISAASNQYEFYQTSDDPDNYKYVGIKTFGHVGGFVRFQWPFDRVVPYLDVAAGYSFADYRWDIYDPSTDWNDVTGEWSNDDYDGDYYYYDDYDYHPEPEQITKFKTRHFTFALEPGIDFFVSKRRFAIGLNAWLPVIASNDSSTDNVGVMFNLTYMPIWRERPRLKPEYDVAMAR